MDGQGREYLKVPEVAQVLRIARSRAYELVADGEIPSVRIGRSIRVNRGQLDDWLEGRRCDRAAGTCARHSYGGGGRRGARRR